MANKQRVIAIFDVGKTNKKLFLFNENYKIVFERLAKFNETLDEDGFVSENLDSLKQSVFDSLHEVVNHPDYDVKAINFTTYGASFVYIDEAGNPVAPLYNYLKPYDPALLQQFYDTYGGEKEFSKVTASPVLGNLNSGMQLYRMKYEKPEVFAKTAYALHLPQYMSYLITGKVFSDITSIGCHTNMWDFKKGDYHRWIYEEGMFEKLAPIVEADSTIKSAFGDDKYQVGIGMHDSSAALIPYLTSFHEPFILISTGTWCISLNPFNQSPLTEAELEQDCLFYMSYKSSPVKAARLFAGYFHEQETARIAAHFNLTGSWYKHVDYNPSIIARLADPMKMYAERSHMNLKETIFAKKEIGSFGSPEEAYHQLILDLVNQQVVSTQLILQGTGIRRIFVDGGFSKNPIYMKLLAHYFPEVEVFAASMAQATALGTALSVHREWNENPLPDDIIELKYYSTAQDFVL